MNLFKKNLRKLIIHILKFVINKDKSKEYDLLNNYIKFNLKNLKLSEVKLYVNNNYIIKIGFESFYIYKNLVDINYQVITDIKKFNVENYYIDDYYNYNYGNDAIIIKLFTNLYLKNNKIDIKKEEIDIKKEDNKNIIDIKIEDNKNIIDIKKEDNKNIIDIKIEDENIIENIEKSTILNDNEKSTILNDYDLDVLNWLNN